MLWYLLLFSCPVSENDDLESNNILSYLIAPNI
jgi:hypothetical protein